MFLVHIKIKFIHKQLVTVITNSYSTKSDPSYKNFANKE